MASAFLAATRSAIDDPSVLVEIFRAAGIADHDRGATREAACNSRDPKKVDIVKKENGAARKVHFKLHGSLAQD
jgi:hypothetical protein